MDSTITAAERLDILTREVATPSPHHFARADVAIALREIDRLREALASYQSESAQYDRDHERLSAELKQARAKVRAVEQAHCWTNEDGKRFVFAEDLLAAVQLANLVCTCHAETVHQAECDTA
jgi:hypothetical protein